ncbi:MAG TPA: DnaD domain protein [Chloroflexia bacterium]|nr:DnaD domain protein [Chloroflexia bacterium]
MKPFIGFSSDRLKTVRVPEGFFEDVLPAITSMLEMKVTLYLFWRLARHGAPDGHAAGVPRMVSLDEMEGDTALRGGLSPVKGPRPWVEALRDGLELAVARGTLLQMWVREEPNDLSEGRAEAWFMLNTRDNRTWLEALGKGKIDVTTTPLVATNGHNGHNGSNGQNGHNGHTEDKSKIQNLKSKIQIVVERPTIFALYEQNIGLLTPLLAEKLQDAEGRYPLEWIEAAFEEAVTNNKRNWRYIERILERWAVEGMNSGKDRGPAERSLDPDKYTKGKYAFLFRPD